MKKLLVIFLILVGLLLGIILAVPVFFKSKIIQSIRGAVNEQLTATVNFDDDIQLSLIRHFPNLSIGIKQVEVINHGDFDGDTLLILNKFSATIDIMSLVKGDEIRIRSIALDKPRIHAHILKDGRANWDITQSSSDSGQMDTSSSDAGDFEISLKSYEISDGQLVYADEQGNMSALLLGINHKGKGDFSKDDFILDTRTEIASLSYEMDGLNYLDNVNLEWNMKLGMNMPGMRFDFQKNELRMNALKVGFEGFVAMPDDNTNMEIRLKSEQVSLKEILSLIPSMYTEDFDAVKADGVTQLDLNLKGTYNGDLELYPAYELKLLVDNGQVIYPGLPESINDIQINLRVNNADGAPDHTVVNLDRLHLLFGKEPLDAKLLFTQPISAPYIDMKAKGQVNLDNLSKMIPLDDGTRLKGLLMTDIQAKGHVSDFTGDDYEAMSASGKLQLSDFVYADKESLPYEFRKLDMDLNPKKVILNELSGKYGHTDFQAKGELENFLAYAFKEGEILKGALDLQSSLFDCNSFLTDEGEQNEQPEPFDSMELQAYAVPANIDFNLNLHLNKVLYDNLVIEPLSGQALLKDQTLYFQGVQMGLFEGQVKMDGYYRSQNPDQPETKVKLALENINIKQSFEYVNTIKILAPIAEYLDGKINLSMDMNSLLNKDLSPVLSSINSDGFLQTMDAVLSGFKPTNALADKLNLQQFRSIPLGKTNLFYAIQDGKVRLKEAVKLKLDQLLLDIEKDGYTTFDQLIQYKMKITLPKAVLGDAGNSAIQGLIGEASKAGIQLNNPDKLIINALISGTLKNPKITTSFNEIKTDLTNQVKNEVKKVIEDQKEQVKKKVDDELEKRLAQAAAKGDQLIAKAKEEAEKLKAEAQKTGDQLIAEAQKQSDDLVKQAGANPLKKVAAEKTGQAMVQEARKKADALNAEAAKKADALIQKAEDEKARLIQEARSEKSGLMP